jgi:hypothetical protein
MPGPDELADEAQDPEPPPWILGSAVDPEVADETRERIHAALTDPQLKRRFRLQHPLLLGADYDEMVRVLGYVWDCPADGTANVTGYRCPRCGRGRSAAGA